MEVVSKQLLLLPDLWHRSLRLLSRPFGDVARHDRPDTTDAYTGMNGVFEKKASMSLDADRFCADKLHVARSILIDIAILRR